MPEVEAFGMRGPNYRWRGGRQHYRWGSVWLRALRLLWLVVDETAKRLVARLRELREALGLTQEAFAERAGLKYKHYQAVEAGRKRDIRFSTLQKLAKACGLEPWELLNFDSPPMVAAEDPGPGPGQPRKGKAVRIPAASRSSRTTRRPRR